ncbi:MAG: nucleotidyl transferase AbiEii/AbiGii toxin family protein [Gammaproteobacteria bacterium]|nr:nucleotidyl transferase AbiEii/AbiGii toxin family protein [Gammaproteobacteria bacterium]
MADSFLELTRDDQRDALAVVAEGLGRPPELLEKDVWVVWVLDALSGLPDARNLVFKGGTSLSKAYGVIQRFSEDLDLTYDIRALGADLVEGHPNALPPSVTQANKWSKVLRMRLARWIHEDLCHHMHARIGQLPITLEPAEGERLLVHYEPLYTGTDYVKPTVVMEFGARGTAEPNAVCEIVCDASRASLDLVFPQAQVRTMSAERTFWEKLTAIHVACIQQRFRGSDRFSRHWYDLVQLHQAGIAENALNDISTGESVAAHKALFFRENDLTNNRIDYADVVSTGALHIVPDEPFLSELKTDFDAMCSAGLIEQAVDLDFETLMQACRSLEELIGKL